MIKINKDDTRDLTKMMELWDRCEYEAHDYIVDLWGIIEGIQSYLWKEYHYHDPDTSAEMLDKLLDICQEVDSIAGGVYPK